MTNRTNAQVLQVICRKARQYRFVNLVLAERSLIPCKAKAPQPNDNVRDGGLSLLSGHDRPNEKGCPAQVLAPSARARSSEYVRWRIPRGLSGKARTGPGCRRAAY